MKRSKITNLLIVVFLIFSVLIPTNNLSAQELEKKRGYKGNISKEKILSTFINGKCVVGHVIKGDDIIEIIKATDHEIRISASIIEGGLNFTKLPRKSLSRELREKVKVWDTQEKIALVFPHDETCHGLAHIVKNRIDITNSEIRSDSINRFSINATATLFFKHNSYRNVVFSGEAVFRAATFSSWAGFQEATFSGKADFRAATFGGWADFQEATFGGWADFLWSTFSFMADFRAATFSGLAVFHKAAFGGAEFQEAAFSGLADFSLTTFGGYTDFRAATFGGLADFSLTTFNKLANFQAATFSDEAYFRRTSFPDALDLSSSKFKKYLDFRNAKIRRLNFNSHIRPSILRGRIDFRKSMISEAHFQDIIFENDVDFSDVQFGIPIGTKKDKRLAVIFRFITFQSDAYFIGTKFCGDTAFERVTFKKDSNFTNAIFKVKKSEGKGKFSLSYLNFKNLFIKWDQLPNIKCWVTDSSGRIKSFVEIKEEQKKKAESGQQRRDEIKDEELEPLSHVFKGLEANFRTINQLSDANQAYYHRKKAELKETKKRDDFWLTTQREAEWIFWGIPCGYGTKIYWIIGWSALITLLFAVIYSIKGELNRRPHPETKQEFNFKQRIFDLPKEYYSKNSMVVVKNHSARKFIRKFINALRFSAAILFKVVYRDTTISGKILGIYKYILWLEWVLGYYILIALVATLWNTMPIFIKSLITGVF